MVSSASSSSPSLFSLILLASPIRPHLCYLAYATPKNPPEDYISSSKTIQDLIVSELEGEETDQEEKREQPDSIPIGVVVSKLDRHLKGERLMRGYIAMLSVDPNWRRRGVGELS